MLALFLLRKNIGFFGKAFFLKERFVLKENLFLIWIFGFVFVGSAHDPASPIRA